MTVIITISVKFTVGSGMRVRSCAMVIARANSRTRGRRAHTQQAVIGQVDYVQQRERVVRAPGVRQNATELVSGPAEGLQEGGLAQVLRQLPYESQTG